eukprot:4228207-Amphidinium_carterae.1
MTRLLPNTDLYEQSAYNYIVGTQHHHAKWIQLGAHCYRWSQLRGMGTRDATAEPSCVECQDLRIQDPGNLGTLK